MGQGPVEIENAARISSCPSILSGESRELDFVSIDHVALLVDEPEAPPRFLLLDVGSPDPRPRICPARCATNDDLERHLQLEGAPLEVVEGRFVAMDPRCGDLLVEEPPAESNGSVEAAILVQRIERIAWVSAWPGLQSAAEGLSGDDSARQSCPGDGPISHGFAQIIGASDTRIW